jgi:hypothetical protein
MKKEKKKTRRQSRFLAPSQLHCLCPYQDIILSLPLKTATLSDICTGLILTRTVISQQAETT